MENWPLPPFFRDGRNGDDVPPLDVMAFRMAGMTVSGTLAHFLPDTGVVTIAGARGETPRTIPLLEIKGLHLVAPIPIVPDAGFRDLYREAGGGEITLPDHKPFTITFVDGDSMSGKTRGFVRNRHGLFLNLLLDGGRIMRAFVPASSVKEVNIGGLLGEAVVKLALAPRTAVEQALDRQAGLHKLRLGEQLLHDGLVGPEQVRAALDHQSNAHQTKLGEILIARGMVSRQQLVEALPQMRRNRQARLGDILIEMGVLTAAGLSRAIAEQLGIPRVVLKDLVIDEATLKLVPAFFARQHHVLPLLATDRTLAVAVENPLAADYLEELRFSSQRQIALFVADPEELLALIEAQYGGRESASQDASIGDEIEQMGLAMSGAAALAGDTQVSDGDAVVVRLVNKMILDAFKLGASDVHVEGYPDGQDTRIRFRVDGEMSPYLGVPSGLRSALISRLKIMANLDISDHRRPQDGKIDFSRYAPVKLELRVASLPTVNNLEDVVLRLLASSKPIPLAGLGVGPALKALLGTMVQRNYGLILVCGPTGSGKTTTLHSLLAEVNTPENKIWTAEDPIEITHSGLRQIQMNAVAGLTFATAMRAFLRADPDIIMVGEMRDVETTRIAIEASLTGHLVLSTLHTNSAPESVVRLLDMGADPFNFADALIGVLSQRLARRLCGHCRQAYPASVEDLDQLAREYCADTALEPAVVLAQWRLRPTVPPGSPMRLYRPVGCPKCRDSGYHGRVGLYELMEATATIKRLIQARSTVQLLFEQAARDGMLRLRQYGIETVLAGDCDLRSVRGACA